ncbi:hypothetical protein ACWA1F_02585 [Flavobacterium sp. 3-218]
MRNNLIFSLLMVCFYGCSQNKTEIIMQNPEITEKNIVDKLASNVKHYKKESMYQLLIKSNWCSSEILVNDIPVYKNFQKPLDAPTQDINNCIFKSGIQKVTVRLYPVGNYKDENIDKFIPETSMSIIVNEYDKKTDKDTEIGKFATVKKGLNEDNRPIIIGNSKTYYEASFTFEAEVPYAIENFENARDLKDWDKELLEKKLVSEYHKIQSIYQNKEYDNIAKISYPNLKNQFISEYQNRDYINDVWTMLMDAYRLSSFEMQPIENYKMVFFADGKLVALMQDSIDPRVRGNSSLWAKFDDGVGIKTLFCNRYFYIPKGETEFKIY